MFSILAALRTLILPYGQPSNAPQIVINEDPVRAELQTLYANRVISDFIFQKARNDYVYQSLVSPLVGKPFLAFGGEESVSLVVSEAMRILPGGFGGSALDNASSVSFSGQMFADGPAMPRGYRDANVSTAGVLASSGGVEVAVPSASWANEPTYNFLGGQVYELMLTTGALPDAAADSVTIVRVRKGSATTGGQQLAYWQIPIDQIEATNLCTHTHVAWLMNNTINTISTQLSLTNQRIAGAPNTKLYGDANIPMALTVKHVGRINDQGGLSLIAASIV